MELNVLENKKNRIVVEIHGVDHTFCNALKQELWNDKNVTVSTYNISHPLVGVPKFIVESKSEAKTSLLDAVKRIQKKNKDFTASISKI